MKNLKDLKQELLDNKINKFYVFYGPDFGIRKHYINKIKESFSNCICLENYTFYKKINSKGGLFENKDLIIIQGDDLFESQSSSFIEYFIDHIKSDTIIFDYEDLKNNSILLTNFGEYVTYFPLVKDEIANQFIDSEVLLSESSKTYLSWNCDNNYSNILLETDKIKNYAQAKNLSHEMAYNELLNQNQMIEKFKEFHSYELMNDILQGNYKNLSEWIYIINNTFLEDFWITLESIANDFIIAYYIQKFGKMKGSTKAYEDKFYWSRIKCIREFNIPYTADDLLEKAELTCKLDAQVKFGKIEKDKVFDYFLCIIV